MHLPHDVLCAVPLEGIENSPIFCSPSEGQSILSTVLDAVTFMYHAIVDAVTFIVDTATSLAVFALEAIATITDVVCQDIIDAANVIVDAFDAFVDWLVEAISDMLEALVAEPLQTIHDSMASWASRLVLLLDVAATDIAGGADNASASRQLFEHIIGSDLFTILTAIGVSLVVAVTAMQLMGPAGLVSSLVPSLLVDVLLAGMVAALFTVVDTGDVLGWVADGIVGILGDDLVGGMANVMGATIGTIGWLASMMSAPVIGDVTGFVLSSMGAFLSWWGTMVSDWAQSMTLDIFGVAVSTFGCYKTFVHPDGNLLKNPTAQSILKGLSLIEAGIATFELTTTVASHE